jgi:hypothetical protein
VLNNQESLSTDINVITAEINSYKQIAGQAIFEIGYRLKGVRDNPKTYGFEGYRGWERWCETECDTSRKTANKFIQAYEQFGATSRQLPVGKIFEMLSLPSEVDREEFITTKHTVPSTGDTKTVNEMTVRELREVKRELKKAEERAKKAEEDYEVIRDTVESMREQPPTIEYKTEYVEVIPSDYKEIKEQNERFRELFGDQSIYSGNLRRVGNDEAITYTVFEFSEDIRKFIEKYGHLVYFTREFNQMIDEGKDEYRKSIDSMKRFFKEIEKSLETECVIINQ